MAKGHHKYHMFKSSQLLLQSYSAKFSPSELMKSLQMDRSKTLDYSVLLMPHSFQQQILLHSPGPLNMSRILFLIISNRMFCLDDQNSLLLSYPPFSLFSTLQSHSVKMLNLILSHSSTLKIPPLVSYFTSELKPGPYMIYPLLPLWLSFTSLWTQEPPQSIYKPHMFLLQNLCTPPQISK